jgi:hypothetical protein
MSEGSDVQAESPEPDTAVPGEEGALDQLSGGEAPAEAGAEDATPAEESGNDTPGDETDGV